MANKPGATSEEIKLQLINELRCLYEKLGRIPDRLDWVIYTDKKWQPYFKTWPSFLTETGLFDSAKAASAAVPRHYQTDKLCEALRAIEEHLGRITREEDWIALVGSISWTKYFAVYSPKPCWKDIDSTSRPKAMKELSRAYSEGTYHFYSDDKSDWLNFRYAAGLDQYSQEELITLGVKNLNAMQERDHSLEKRLKLMDASEALQDVQIKNNFVKGLPHFAIHDQFGTLREYFDIVVGHWLQGNPPIQEAHEHTRANQETPSTHPVKQSTDELISSLKSIATELEQRGWLVEINLRIN